MRMITRGWTDPLILVQTCTHTHPRPSLTLSHIYFRVFGVMGVPTLFDTIGSISTRNRIHTYKS